MSLIYEDKTKLIPNDCYLFSVTDINLYKNNPTQFFKKVLLKETEFNINFNATLGTCIHHLCSSIITNSNNLSNTLDEIAEFIEELNPLEIDKALLWNRFIQMKDVVVATINQNNFVFGEPLGIEETYLEKLTNKVYLGGTLDIRYKDFILDYKTTTNKFIKPVSDFPEKYSNQLYAYTWLCSKKNIEINKLGLQYFTQPDINRYSEITGKALKDYPCVDILSVKDIQTELLTEIENLIYLIADTIEYILANPKSFKYFARDLNLELKD